MSSAGSLVNKNTTVWLFATIEVSSRVHRVIDVNYSCRRASIILAGPDVAEVRLAVDRLMCR